MAVLIDIGFDSFTENVDGITGYIPSASFDENSLRDVISQYQEGAEISYTISEMPDINWNEEWEKNFQPIRVEDKVLIRAEFHEPEPALHQIIIQPKMSFGTGHHPTTYLMIQQMLDIDFEGKKVLDMGAGTSLLAIYAMQRGAAEADAIDIDHWAVENSVENAARNGVVLRVEQGTSENLGDKKYDIILANINRNVLMDDIPRYVDVLHDKGLLILSGLCFFDENDILEVCQAASLTLEQRLQREEWVSLRLRN